MNPNKYNVYLHIPWEPVGTPGVPPFEHYPKCTNVENDGPILCFTDKEGVFRKTSAPWTIESVKE